VLLDGNIDQHDAEIASVERAIALHQQRIDALGREQVRQQRDQAERERQQRVDKIEAVFGDRGKAVAALATKVKELAAALGRLDAIDAELVGLCGMRPSIHVRAAVDKALAAYRGRHAVAAAGRQKHVADVMADLVVTESERQAGALEQLRQPEGEIAA
jgi:hypothetical protein